MKLTQHKYLKDIGLTRITLSDKYGRYYGFSTCHPDDLDFKSEYAGGRIAQGRAWIKALTEHRRRKKNMLAAIENLNKDIQSTCSNIDPKIQRRINLKLRDYNKDIQELTSQIEEIKNQILKDIKVRDNIIQKSKKAGQN